MGPLVPAPASVRTALVLGALVASLALPAAAPAAIPTANLGASMQIRGAAGDMDTGYRVANAGDVNGDGRPDVLVSATKGGRLGAGRVYVVFGRTGGFVDDVDLGAFGTRGFRILGPPPAVQGGLVYPAGADVAAAGDVNGDGLGDIAIGAPFSGAVSRGLPGGKAWVVFGRKATSDVDLDHLGTAGFTITGRPESFTGTTVAGVGDFDSDGLADVAIGANENEATRYAGAVYVIWGSRSPSDVDLARPGLAALRIQGDSASSRCRVVRAIGDVNGDQRPDLAVLCPRHADPIYGANESMSVTPSTSYVVFGRLGRLSALNLASAGLNAMKITGRYKLDDVLTATGLGDVNGDGRNDFALGSPGTGAAASGSPANAPGAVYVIYGRAGNVAINLGALGIRGRRIDGEMPGDEFGLQLAGPGDVTGDGRGDLIVASWWHTRSPRIGAGAAWLLPGLAGTTPLQVATYPGGMRGDGNTLDTAGKGVAAIGDFQGDGIPDMAVGAPNDFRGTGRVYLVPLPFIR